MALIYDDFRLDAAPRSGGTCVANPEQSHLAGGGALYLVAAR
jgi:hypothetical protein